MKETSEGSEKDCRLKLKNEVFKNNEYVPLLDPLDLNGEETAVWLLRSLYHFPPCILSC